jgi:hypothetical protein
MPHFDHPVIEDPLLETELRMLPQGRLVAHKEWHPPSIANVLN